MKMGDTSIASILGASGAVYALVVLNLVLSLAGIAGTWAVIFAVGIAGLQAILIGLFSMELIASRRSVVVIAVVAPLFVVLLLALTVVDVYTRAPALLDPPPVDRTVPTPPP